MASNLTDFGAQKLAVCVNDSGVMPPIWYLALYTAVQDAAQSAAECSDPDYERQVINWAAPSGGVTENSGAINFPGLTTSQDYFAIGICEAATEGVLDAWWVADLPDSPVNVPAGSQAQVPDGLLTETMVVLV